MVIELKAKKNGKNKMKIIIKNHKVNTYLVEEYNSDVKFDKNSVIVALTPKVCYRLDKAGIKYSIIEDYYDEVELLADEDDLYKLQLQWIDRLDEFLQNNIAKLKELNLKMGTIYHWYLRGMILGPLYVRCFTLKMLFEKLKPSNVIFISRKLEEPFLNYQFEYYGKSFYSQIIPIICGEHNIPLKLAFLEGDDKSVERIKDKDIAIKFRKMLYHLYYRFEIVRRMHFLYMQYKNYSFLKQTNKNKLNIFILKTPHIGLNFVIGALNTGHNIYQLSSDFILKYSSFGAKRYLNLKTEYEDKIMDLKNTNIWEDTADLLESSDLIKWFNEQYEIDVSEIILSRLKHFISKVCPKILVYFKFFTEFYKKERIDFVFTPHESSLIEYAALAAANYCDNVKTVGIQHGNDIFLNPVWCIHEMTHYNLYICTDKEIEEHFKWLCKTKHYPTKIYSSSHRLLNVKKICGSKERNNNIKKNRIIYLPTFLLWDTRKMGGYPDTWYYKFQKSLIEYFSTRKEFVFVWKGLPQSDAIYNPIPDFIRDSNFSNIEIATDTFQNHLPSVGRVICDHPSTGFYESVVAGVPTMSLYHKTFKTRKSAVEHFGNLLKLYSDIPEAIKRIDEFLNSDPELYKTTIDMEDKNIVEILEENSWKINCGKLLNQKV